MATSPPGEMYAPAPLAALAAPKVNGPGTLLDRTVTVRLAEPVSTVKPFSEIASYCTVACAWVPFRGVHVPLQFPLPVCTRFTEVSPSLNVAKTEPSDEVTAFPQLSTTRACIDAGTPTVTLLPGLVNDVG